MLRNQPFVVPVPRLPRLGLGHASGSGGLRLRAVCPVPPTPRSAIRRSVRASCLAERVATEGFIGRDREVIRVHFASATVPAEETEQAHFLREGAYSLREPLST